MAHSFLTEVSPTSCILQHLTKVKIGMVINTSIKEDAWRRLSVIGVPGYVIKPMLNDIFRWIECSGVEWSVKRLKTIKQAFIAHGANQPWSLPWIRKNSKGKPYGWIGSLFKWISGPNHRKNLKRFSRVIQATNIYTLWRSETVTMSQLKKFLDGVNCLDPINLPESFYKDFDIFLRIELPKEQIIRGYNSVWEYRGSPSKRAPRPHNRPSVPQDSNILDERDWFMNKEGYRLGWEYNELYAPVFRGLNGPLYPRKIKDVDPHPYGGEVHFLQEPGMKLRAIASPYRIHQLALKPLGDAIYRIVKRLKFDCTFDQSKAIPRIQEALSEGRVVHSIDLSGATDYFPLGLQLMVLRSIFGDSKDIDLFEEISRMRWKSLEGDIQWKRGQPLGLYPSFGSFTLTHGMVLAFLECEIRACTLNECEGFYVVGDDVVILDDRLAEKYKEFLTLCNCPWSNEKSISSPFLAEFAGKIITSSLVIPSYKWRKSSDENFLDICRNLGPRSRSLLTKRQRKVFDVVKHLLPPLGLGFNRPGATLTDIFLETTAFEAKLAETRTRSLVDLIHHLNSLHYSHDGSYDVDLEQINDIRKTFVEKVCLVFQQTVFRSLASFWQAVSDLPQALDIKPRLPTEMLSPSRVSTLVRFEGYLKQ